MTPRAKEADELQHHDQRPRRGLGEAKSIEHLRGAEPLIILHRLLRDVGQHRIGATECDHRGLAEKNPLAKERVIRAQPERQRDEGREPQGE